MTSRQLEKGPATTGTGTCEAYEDGIGTDTEMEDGPAEAPAEAPVPQQKESPL